MEIKYTASVKKPRTARARTDGEIESEVCCCVLM